MFTIKSIIPWLLLLTACASPYLKMDSNLTPDRTHETLLASAVVDVNIEVNDTSQNLNATNTASFLIQNSELDPFGEDMIKQAESFLQSKGFNVIIDTERAKSLSLYKEDNLKNFATIVGGYWISKETSGYRADSSSIMFQGTRKKVANKLNTENSNEAFAFVSVMITQRTSWLIMKYPQVRAEVHVLNEHGEWYLRARGYGKGKATPFLLIRDAEKLSTALEDAFTQINMQEIKPLK